MKVSPVIIIISLLTLAEMFFDHSMGWGVFLFVSYGVYKSKDSILSLLLESTKEK